VIVVGKKLPLLLSGGARGTNAEVYGYGGNATSWQARAFGAVGFPVPIKKVLIAPTFEIDQEPHHLAYVTYANIPTTLIYAVRISRYPDMKWSVDIGTGHVVSTAAPGVALKANDALAVALDYRFFDHWLCTARPAVPSNAGNRIPSDIRSNLCESRRHCHGLQGGTHVNAAALSAIAALGGTALGGLTPLISNYLIQKGLTKRELLTRELAVRQTVYVDFIQFATKEMWMS
jgi:hypothetical protein